MKRYLVGGAVRDQLLGLDVKDRDWVVVGSDIATMESLGYQQVGQSFPVFLHPDTHEEHALARKERKEGSGYTGFVCDFAPSVTLEEDLLRRDLTVNAIAMDENGTLVDPYGGQSDLKKRILRHVSPAFVEDPLRVLRVARFAARFASIGFTVAPETMTLMQKIAESGELTTLTQERVWKEWEKSLSYDNPEVFLQVLRDCGALKFVIPEIDALYGVPQPEKWHPEIDTGIHTIMVAARAAEISKDPLVRFAAQVHDLGKAKTPEAEWPSHKMHCQTGQKVIRELCERLRISNDFRDAALVVCAEHSNVHRAFELKPSTFIKVFDRIDAWRKPERLKILADTCRADYQGRTGFENEPYEQANRLLAAFDAAQCVQVKPIVEAGFKGAQIKEQLGIQRAEAVARALA